MNTEILGLKIPPSDLCHVQWRSLAWVLENGPITALNVMDYFSLSPFYDRHSTNQVLKMQSMFSGQPQMSPEEEKEALRKLVGIEFEVILSRPEQDREGGLFVIEKRERKSYDEYYPIAAYYVLRTSIYQSPSIHSTLSARVLSSLSTLSELLNLARSHKPTYDPCHGYAWKIKERSKGDDQEKDFDKKKKVKENESVEHRVDTSERTGTETEPMDIDDDEKLIGSSKISKINSTVKSSNPNVDPPTVSNTTEIFNPILFRALQTTTSNFPAFR
ncbi:MED6 mediator sub complex component-domain-containing protein, partial [Phakopsora pachyrhizi]